jgi:hypothetical protein
MARMRQATARRAESEVVIVTATLMRHGSPVASSSPRTQFLPSSRPMSALGMAWRFVCTNHRVQMCEGLNIANSLLAVAQTFSAAPVAFRTL